MTRALTIMSKVKTPSRSATVDFKFDQGLPSNFEIIRSMLNLGFEPALALIPNDMTKSTYHHSQLLVEV